LQNAKSQFIDIKEPGKLCKDIDREGFMGAIRLWCALLVTGMIATAASAQDFPTRPITLVNPYAAGGPADLLARTIATGMSDLLGQQVVILNRPGGATAIGAAYVAGAAADGYTLLIAGASSHIVTPALTKVTYDGIKDFAPVAMVANVPNVLVVRPSLPVKTVPELVALAKSKPGVLNYGSVGNGSQPHLAAEMFKQLAGVDFTHVPYKGAAPAVTDLLGGQIDLAFLNAPPLLPHIQSGKLRALAVTTMKRAQQLPDVPTLNELGLSGFDVSTWYGMTAPAATPKPVMDKLTAAVSRVLNSPDVNAKLMSQGAEVFLLAPKDFSTYLQEDAARLIKLIKNANIQAGE
jgi:tripartite-type tricarboxylate transporter receptor subunit TctC